MKSKPCGFTLIELLVVIAIIAVLMSILMPALSRVKEQARAVVCLNNLKQIGMGVQMYAQEFENKVPRRGSEWPFQFMAYMDRNKKYDENNRSKNYDKFGEVGTFKCPSFPRKDQLVCYAINNLKVGSFGGQSERYTRLDDFPRKSDTIFLADYEYDFDETDGIQKVIVTTDDLSKCNWMDIHHEAALPWDIKNRRPRDTRRMALERHRPFKINCLFVDGHAGKRDTKTLTLYDLGGAKAILKDLDG